VKIYVNKDFCLICRKISVGETRVNVESDIALFEPVAARAYRILERMIVTLELAPGSITTEGVLIERLGLGRTPVREAVQRLSWEGLLEVRPRAGLAVTPLHAGDWLKVLDARRGVEVILARSAARFFTRDMAVRFLNAARAMQQAVMAASVDDFLIADKALDEAINAAADNGFASRLAGPLQTHSRRFWYRYRSEAGLAESAAQHVEIIRAILAHDEDAAAEQADLLISLLRSEAEAVAAGL
jgi:DNA-binding GntR family transcriptional regulator